MKVLELRVAELESLNQTILGENQRLAEMCEWILSAQRRSKAKNSEEKLNDYREAMTDQVELLQQNSSFRIAYTDLMDQYQAGILNTQPDQQEARENLYLKSHVLQELLLKIDNQKKHIEVNEMQTAKKKLKAVD